MGGTHRGGGASWGPPEQHGFSSQHPDLPLQNKCPWKGAVFAWDHAGAAQPGSVGCKIIGVDAKMSPLPWRQESHGDMLFYTASANEGGPDLWNETHFKRSTKLTITGGLNRTGILNQTEPCLRLPLFYVLLRLQLHLLWKLMMSLHASQRKHH